MFSVAAILLCAWFLFIRETEEQRVLKKLDQLEAASTVKPSSDLLEKAKVIKAFRELFADPVAISTTLKEANGVRSPDELAAILLAAARQGYTLDLDFSSPSVTFPAENEAAITTVAKGSAQDPNQNNRERELSINLMIRLGKDNEGEWRFETFSER